MKKLFFLLLLAALAGCATGPSLQTRMAGYIGDSSQSLVQRLGVPDKQITTGGVQYLAYNVRHEQQIDPSGFGWGGYYGPYAGPFFPGGYYGGGWDAGFPSTIQDYSCTATFMLKDDRVDNFTLRGNDCG